MKKEKNSFRGKKTKKYTMTHKTWIILTIVSLLVIALVIFLLTYTSSEKYEKKKIERTLSKWAKEYYTETLVEAASEYIKEKAKSGENITINLDAMKKIGKDTEIVKNHKTDRKCDDLNTYVSIKVDKDAKDIKKEYTVEKVVLDCFN